MMDGLRVINKFLDILLYQGVYFVEEVNQWTQFHFAL